jgi:hypothetical protein
MLALIFVSSLTAAELPADSISREQVPGKMKVFLVRGDATVTLDKGATLPLKRGMEFLADGATINTEDDSAVYLIAENGTGSNIGPNSTLHIKTYKQAPFDQSLGTYQLAGNNIGDSTTHLVLIRGEVAGDVKSDIGLYKLETKAAVTDVTGCTFHTSFDPGSGADDFVHKTLTLNQRTKEGDVILTPTNKQLTDIQVYESGTSNADAAGDTSTESINIPPGTEVTIRGKNIQITKVDDIRLANLFRGMFATAPIYTPDNSIISPSGG